MKKVKKPLFVLLCMLMAALTTVMLAACGGKPVEKSGAPREFTLDIAGTTEQVIDIEDYVDTKNTKDLEYSTSVDGGSLTGFMTVSAIRDQKFTVTALSAGVTSSIVRTINIVVTKNESEQLKIPLKFTVVDTRVNHTISGYEDGFGYTMQANAKVVDGLDYTFTITREYGYKGTPLFNYTLKGAAGEPLTPVESPAGTFKYTIPADKMGDLVFVKRSAASTSIIEGFSYDTYVEGAVPALSSGFFTLAGWDNYGGSGSAALENDRLKFVSGVRMRNGSASLPSALVQNLSAQDNIWPYENDADVGPYSLTFMFKAEGNFLISFLSSGATTPNELRLRYDGEKLTLGRSVGGVAATFGVAPDTETGFTTGVEYRFDIVVTAVKKKVTANGLADWEATDPQSGLLKVEFFINGERVAFKTSIDGSAVSSNTTTSGHHFRLDNGVTYIQRLNLPGAPQRYNNFMYFDTTPENSGAVYVWPAYELGERYEVSGQNQSGAGYAMYGAAGARGGMDYILTLERNASFTGTPSIATTIGDVSYTLVAPTVTGDTFVFTIPGSDITGDIVFGAVTGLMRYRYGVTLPQDGPAFTITGAAQEAVYQTDYTFTLNVGTGYQTDINFTVTYKIGSAAAAALTVTGSGPSYSFTIPGAAVTDDIVIAVTGVVQTAVTYNITGIADGTGYTMTGTSTHSVPNTEDYVITVALLSNYGVPDSIKLTVRMDGKEIEITGNLEGGVYKFYLASERIVGNVTIVSLTGVVSVINVSGTVSDVGYNITGAEKAYGGTNYVFTVYVNNPLTIPAPTYTINGVTKAAVFVSSSADGRLYVFEIPKSDYVVGQPIAINSGFAPSAGVTAKTIKEDLTIPSGTRTGSFNFEDFVNVNGVTGTITYEAENLSGGNATLNSEGNTFTLIAGSSMRLGTRTTVRIWVIVNGVRVYKTDVVIILTFTPLEDLAAGADNTNKDADNLLASTSNFFNAGSWSALSSATAPRNTAPVLQSDGSLKFTNTVRRQDNFLASGLRSDTALTPENVRAYTYSFMFMTPDDEFVMRFMTNGNNVDAPTINSSGISNNTGNSYDLTHKNGTFYYYAALGNAFTTVYNFEAAEYEKGKWNRFDIEFTTVMDDLDGVAGTGHTGAAGVIETRIYINGIYQKMKDSSGSYDHAPKTSEGSLNRVTRLVDGVPSFMRRGSTGSFSYMNGVTIQTATNGSISIAPATFAGAQAASEPDAETTVFNLSVPSLTPGEHTGSFTGSVLTNLNLNYVFGTLGTGGSTSFTRAFKVEQLTGNATKNIRLLAPVSSEVRDVLNNLRAIEDQWDDATNAMKYFYNNANANGYGGYLSAINGDQRSSGSAASGEFMFYADQIGEYVITCDIVEVQSASVTVRGSYSMLVEFIDAGTLTTVAVTGVSDTGYTFDGAATAYEGVNYDFVIEVAAGYIVPDAIAIQYSVGDGSAKEAIFLSVAGNRYRFRIPGSEIDDDVAIGSVTGIKQVFGADVSAVESNEAFTITAGNTAVEDSAYIFTVQISEGYGAPGGVTAHYIMAGSAGGTLTGVYGSGVYTFTIEGITGNIAITAVNGITSQKQYNVTGGASGAGYTVSFDPVATEGQNHLVTVTVDNADTFPTLTYTIDGVTRNAVFDGVSSNNLTYEFLISSAHYADGEDIVLTAGLAADGGISAKTIQSGDEPTFSFFYRNGTYDFDDFIDSSSVSGTVTYLAYPNSGGITVDSLSDSFTLIADSGTEYEIYILVMVDGLPVFRLTLTITEGEPEAGTLPSHFFTPAGQTPDAGWMTFNGGNGMSASESGVLFNAGQNANTGARLQNVFSNNIGTYNASLSDSDWANMPTDHLSFQLKRNGEFRFFITSDNPQNSNFHRIEFGYDGTDFSIGRTISGTVNGAVSQTYGTASAADYGYNGDGIGWDRIDIIITAVRKAVPPSGDGLIDDTTQNGMLKIEIYVNGKKVIFTNGDGLSTTNITSENHRCRLEEGTTYIQRANSAARYGNWFGFLLGNTSSLAIKPV